MRAFWFSHWRSFLPDQIFRRGFLHQLPAQRYVWTRRGLDHIAVRFAEDRPGPLPYLQRKGPQADHNGSGLLRPRNRLSFLPYAFGHEYTSWIVACIT